MYADEELLAAAAEAKSLMNAEAAAVQDENSCSNRVPVNENVQASHLHGLSVEELKQQNLILVRNISRLFLTAKRELSEKNNEIRRLQHLLE